MQLYDAVIPSAHPLQLQRNSLGHDACCNALCLHTRVLTFLTVIIYSAKLLEYSF